MNNDADALRSFLLELLTYFGPTVSSPSGSAVGLDERDLQLTQSGFVAPSTDDSGAGSASENPASPTASTYTKSGSPKKVRMVVILFLKGFRPIKLASECRSILVLHRLSTHNPRENRYSSPQ